MAKAYPQFRSFYSHEEMVEHFLLTPAELQLVLTCRGDTDRCGMALLLKTLSHLGYVPDPMPHVPDEVRSFVAGQIGCYGIPRKATLGMAARVITISRKFVSIPGAGTRLRETRTSWRRGIERRVRWMRTRRMHCLTPQAKDCDSSGLNYQRKQSHAVVQCDSCPAKRDRCRKLGLGIVLTL